MVTDLTTVTSETTWTRTHSHAYIEGFYVSATIDEYDRRWYVAGRLAGMDASLTGRIPEGSLSDLEQAAAAAVVAGIAAGMTAR